MDVHAKYKGTFTLWEGSILMISVSTTDGQNIIVATNDYSPNANHCFPFGG
jgi:hypothetical protein